MSWLKATTHKDLGLPDGRSSSGPLKTGVFPQPARVQVNGEITLVAAAKKVRLALAGSPFFCRLERVLVGTELWTGLWAWFWIGLWIGLWTGLWTINLRKVPECA
jgi:hypothetical protein